MKKVLFLLLLLGTTVLYAQTPSKANMTVKGQAVDSLSRETVPYATIKIFAEGYMERPVKVVPTDDNGKFEFVMEIQGNYIMTIEYIGKKIFARQLQVDDRKLLDMGKIVMEDDNQALGEVVVTAQKPLVKVDIDKIIYSIEDDPEAQTNNVLDMLKKVPMVTVDGEEKVQLKGSSNFKFYMNGKPSTLLESNPKDVLKSIPANTIKDIEVITDPGAKYDAEGVSGIINIITQSQSSLGGYTATLNAGVDSRGGYNAGVYFSVKYGKIGFTGNFNSYTYKAPWGDSYSDRELLQDNDSPGFEKHLTQTGRSKYKGNGLMGYGELSYEIDTLNLINISFNRYEGEGTNLMNYDVEGRNGDNETIRKYRRYSDMKYNYGNTSVGADYQRTFSVRDRLLTASYRLNIMPNDSKSDNEVEPITNYYREQNRQHSDAQTNEHTFQLDFTTPVNKIHTIEAGAKYILRNSKSNSGKEKQDFDNNTWINEPSENDKFRHTQDIIALYAGYSIRLNKWALKAGLRYEATWLEGKMPLSEEYPRFKNDYSNLIPSMAVTYQIKPTQTLRGSYSMSLYRPGIWYLNPYVNTSDSTYIRMGNPGLDAEKYHSISLNYNYFHPKFNMNINLSYGFNNNSVESYSYIETVDYNRPGESDPAKIRQVLYETYANIGKNKNLGLSAYMNWSPTPKFRLYTNMRGGYSDVRSNSELMKLSNHGFSGSIYGGAQVTIPWNILVNAGGYYSTSNIFLEGKSSSYHYYTLSLSKSFLSDRLNIRGYAVNPFNEDLTHKYKQRTDEYSMISENVNKMSRFGVNISFRFGEMKSQIKKAKRGIVNDDTMSGGQGGSGAGGGGGTPQSGGGGQ